jgi:hypothetical protein
MEGDLNLKKKEDDLKKNNATKTIKSKNNGCGTAPGNLVLVIFDVFKPCFIYCNHSHKINFHISIYYLNPGIIRLYSPIMFCFFCERYNYDYIQVSQLILHNSIVQDFTKPE